MSAPHLIIACSLDAGSRSAVLAEALGAELRRRDVPVDTVDLRQVELPFCDAGSCYADPNVLDLQKRIAAAASVTLAVPIYNYDVGGAARNLIALTGRAWTEKVVGFVCAAGGKGSYMSVMGIANSLMLDFRSLIVPRFVYATGADFDGDQVTSETVTERIGELAGELTRISGALAGTET